MRCTLAITNLFQAHHMLGSLEMLRIDYRVLPTGPLIWSCHLPPDITNYIHFCCHSFLI
uniref:Uncharacterized protein n=1 Tax=Anguilla anguilla TaxID=7936 RepID=A0A0E9X003_ANGAN